MYLDAQKFSREFSGLSAGNEEKGGTNPQNFLENFEGIFRVASVKP